VKSVLKERPILTSYPDGIKDAVEIAKLATEANMLKAVQEEKTELENRIKELEAKLQPGGSSVSPGSKSSGIETMKTEEAREYFRRRFAEFDN
jgi:cob(I)alamin adenosyltransferase